MTTELEKVSRAAGAIAIALGGLIVVPVLLAVIVVIVGAACYDWLGSGVDEREIYDIAQRQRTQSQLGPRWTEDGASIVFQNGYTIYVVDSGGTKVIEWVPEGAPKDETFAFDFSPDVGQMPPRIAYTTLRYGLNDNKDLEIATAYLDGSDYRRLTDSAGNDVAPAWSPDGKRIAFLSGRDGSRSPLYVMNANGSNVKNVWRGLPASLATRPVWSPDGMHLAVRDGRSLYVAIDVLGGGMRAKHLGATQTNPAWSPDGRRIAFVQIGPTEETQETETIYISKPDGSEARKVFHSRRPHVSISDLSWSLDGSKLRFTLHGIGQPINKRTLAQIDIDGSNFEEIMEFRTGLHIAWSPDESRIAVLSSDAPSEPIFGNVLLYVTKPDGSDRQVLVRVDSRRGLEAVPWR